MDRAAWGTACCEAALERIEAKVQKMEAEILALQQGQRNTDEVVHALASQQGANNNQEESTCGESEVEHSQTEDNQEEVKVPSSSSSPDDVQFHRISKKIQGGVPMEYQLSGSVWDAAVWVPFVPWLDSIITAFMMVLNVCVQGYFLLLIGQNLGQVSDMGLDAADLEGYLTWRITAAHHIKHHDEITNTSLASRVCNEWSAATASYDQMRTVGAFNRYLGSDSDGFLGAITGGSGLCVLALLCWFFLVASDVCDNMDFVSALLSCAAKSWTAPSVILEPYEITTLGRFHLCAVLLLVVVPRLAVSFALFITGARFLCYTSEIADLILNAVALGFIMDMDEEFFAFLPGRVRNAVSESPPMRMRRWGNFPVDKIRPCFVILVVAAMVSCWNLLLSDVLMRMQLAQDIMCDGNVEFVYALDPATGVISMGATESLQVLDKSTYKFHAVLQGTLLHHDAMLDLAEVVGFGDSWMPGDDVLMLTAELEDVQEIDERSAAESLELSMCEDLDEYPQYLSRLREVMDDTDTSCNALSQNCTLKTVRMFCPRTCGCDTTLNGIYVRTGCSGLCDDLALAEVASVSSKLFGSSGEKCIADAPDAWQQTFTAEMQDYLVDVGSLTETHLWSTAFQNSFADRSFGDYYLSSPGFDVSEWVHTPLLCDSISLFDGLFSTSLCETNFEASLGTLQALCPNECGLCDEVSGVTSVQLTLSQLYEAQTEALGAGVIYEAVFEYNATNSVLTCGSVKVGTTVDAESTYGNGSPEKLYAFVSQSAQHVVVSTCSAADFDTVLRVYNSEWEELTNNDDFSGCAGSTSKLTQEVEEGGILNILVEGYSVSSTGTFELSLECCTDLSDCDYDADAFFFYYYYDADAFLFYYYYEDFYSTDGSGSGSSTSSTPSGWYSSSDPTSVNYEGVYTTYDGGSSTSSTSSGWYSSSDPTYVNYEYDYTAYDGGSSTSSTSSGWYSGSDPTYVNYEYV